jgi:hypothetical protein
MKSKRMIAITLLLACFVTQACTDEDRERAAQASDNMARGISVALDLDAALIEARLLDKDEAITVTSALLDANRLIREFNETAKGFKSIGAAERSALLRIVTGITRSLDRLNEQGVLRLKNPEAKQKFTAALAVVTGAVTVLSTLLTKK